MGAPVPVTCVRITADDPAAAQAMADGFVLSVECGGSRRWAGWVGWLPTGVDDELVSLQVDVYLMAGRAA